MELRFTFFRIAILLALLAGFYFLGGFTNPATLDTADSFNTTKLTKAWLYTVIMFVAGASCVSVVEHEIGLMAPINLKFLYILIGIALMAGGVLWGNTLRQAATQAMG